jgi:protein-S-isoprenylcysteine O-methyltransferase Ste14
VPPHLERSVYVFTASALLALTFWQWRPIPHVAWDVRSGFGQAVLWTVYGIGWAIVVAMTFAIDHLDLTGLRQVYEHGHGTQRTAAQFRLPLPYRLLRHPMMTGFIITFLATPHMSTGHLLFAGLACGYIVVGVHFEERDLIRSIPEYRDYAATTPRFVPRLRNVHVRRDHALSSRTG